MSGSPPKPSDAHHTWPCCSECGAPRQTSCPVCQTPGVDFVIADSMTDAAPVRSVHGDGGVNEFSAHLFRLRCTICDESFVPNYYDRCHQCGFEFEDGIASERIEPDEITPRTVLVAASLVALFLGVIGYFYWLLA